MLMCDSPSLNSLVFSAWGQMGQCVHVASLGCCNSSCLAIICSSPCVLFNAHPAGGYLHPKAACFVIFLHKLAQDCCRAKKLLTLMPAGGIQLRRSLCNTGYASSVPSLEKHRGARESACVWQIMSNVCRQLRNSTICIASLQNSTHECRNTLTPPSPHVFVCVFRL